MSEKTYLYEWQKDDLKDLKDIEKRAFRKADELNDKLLDIKILMDEICDDWDEFKQFLKMKRFPKSVSSDAASA